MQQGQTQGYSQAHLWDPLQGMPLQQMPQHSCAQPGLQSHAMSPEQVQEQQQRTLHAHCQLQQQLFQELQQHPSYQQQQLQEQQRRQAAIQGQQQWRQAGIQEQQQQQAVQQRRQAAILEQQQVEAALQASAAEYRAEHDMAAEAEIRLPVHLHVELEHHRVEQQSAEPLLIQHDGYLAWQSKTPSPSILTPLLAEH